MEEDKAALGALDYVTIAVMLLISTGIGVYFRFTGGKQKTTEEYLMAGRNMPILPVAFSLMASFLSAIAVMGFPAEVYIYGFYYAYTIIGYFIGTVLSSYISLPVFFKMQASTTFEYLEKRFGKLTRLLTSFTFILQIVLYTSLVLYAPALALSAVANISTLVSTISIGLVCTFYCSLGGMKAVLWTDAFQALLMFAGVTTVLIKGFLDVGGIEESFKRANDGGRLAIPGFEFNLVIRYTWWNLIIHGILTSMSSFGVSQVQVQRILTIKSLSRSRRALLAGVILAILFKLLNCVVGIVIYAYYYDCDPLTSPSKVISSADQLLPLYIMTSLVSYPGLAGLCISGIFSASLSTVSSAVNSLTAVTMQDFVREIFDLSRFSEGRIACIAKIVSLFYGLLCVMLTFLVGNFGYLVQASAIFYGLFSGPVLAVFFLGMLTRRCNEKGVVTGLISSVCILAWISFGAAWSGRTKKGLPTSIDGCVLLNASYSSELITSVDDSSAATVETVHFPNATAIYIHQGANDEASSLYNISYMWLTSIGFVSSAAVGYIASVITILVNGKREEVDEDLLSPILGSSPNKKLKVVKEVDLHEASF